MEKRYQVFVSSTFTDLVEERQGVTQALLTLNHFPAGMELFPASNDDQWTLIKGVIDDSDYYCLVIGARYGSTTDDGISYTEKEFDYAVSSGIPILAFLHEDPGSVMAKKTDENDAARQKLLAFRQKVETGRTVKYWRSAASLEARVMQAVSAETKKNPREGWVRGNLSGDPARLNELLSQIDELKASLASATTLPPPGSELYAQGDEFFDVQYRYRMKLSDVRKSATTMLTWNNIFYELGPLLLGESTESQMKARLAEELANYEDELPSIPQDIEIYSEHFETIKVQLVAIGLMGKSQKKHVPSDRNVYWQITPYGEKYLMGLRAIKKGQKTNAGTE